MPLKVDFLGFTHFGGFGGCHGWVGAGTSLLCSVQRAKDAMATSVPLCFQDFPPHLLLTGAAKMRIALCNYTIELLELPEG